MLKPKLLGVIIFCVVVIQWNGVGFSQTARLVHYQGSLMQEDGTSFNGTSDLTFNLYSRIDSEEPIWSEEHKNVQVTDGSYDVLLGSRNPLKLSFYEYYLEVQAAGVNTESPRKMIVGSGYNYRLWFLFAAYTIVWVALFAYVISIARRQKRIIADLEMLSKVRAEKDSVEPV